MPRAPRRSRIAPGDRTPLLEVRGLSKSFGGLRAVQEVASRSQSGEILGIIGPNGAGKTTLFNLLNGVLPADTGSATLDGAGIARAQGAPIAAWASAAPSRWCAASRACRCWTTSSSAPTARAPTTTRPPPPPRPRWKRVGLADRARRPAGQLTNKELRLMELARALAGSPRLLLLDETLAGLGRDECDDVLDVLRRLRAQGMTIVIIEHTMHAMLRLADRFVVLDHGRVLAEGPPRAVVEDRAVIEAYLGSKFLARHNA